jgi:hypothetical protein
MPDAPRPAAAALGSALAAAAALTLFSYEPLYYSLHCPLSCPLSRPADMPQTPRTARQAITMGLAAGLTRRIEPPRIC